MQPWAGFLFVSLPSRLESCAATFAHHLFPGIVCIQRDKNAALYGILCGCLCRQGDVVFDKPVNALGTIEFSVHNPSSAHIHFLLV